LCEDIVLFVSLVFATHACNFVYVRESVLAIPSSFLLLPCCIAND